ncbi:aldo/keto reductase [Paenibacillus spiritus]|uniref:Aldo/keto reductase n=1 Tax=Paenibacillus spiritus TaxID=2496557 RepID=A0A5J5FZ34_9BACL|nr:MULTISPECIES: aldo/keto reductase [Paenibacillus]KAA8999490.1 aldo/keto reductase [Paenibacillus spiritus]
MMERAFGSTGLQVSALGFGAGHIGQDTMTDREAARILNEALDAGITLIDTARGYGLSEERIGKLIGHRRQEFVLSTKIGYGIPGFEDWTAPCIRAGIDAALKLMRTDVLDVVHLHSCPREILEAGEVTEELHRAVEAGKVRVAAYSGENEALEAALHSGSFGSIQLSVNICDQASLESALPAAREGGIGVIAKRPIANAPWRYAERPVGEYVEDYWVRFREMGWHKAELGMNWDELALRFAAFTPGVHSCIVGTANPERLRHNARLLEKGPLPEELEKKLRSDFHSHGADWVGLV